MRNDPSWFSKQLCVLNAKGRLMNERPGVVQRAFQIAKSGEVASLTALHVQLNAECYLNSGEILAGRSVSLQLARIIVERNMVK
jgi:hypothetical protein